MANFNPSINVNPSERSGSFDEHEQINVSGKRVRFEATELPIPVAPPSSPILNPLEERTFTNLTAAEGSSLRVLFEEGAVTILVSSVVQPVEASETADQAPILLQSPLALSEEDSLENLVNIPEPDSPVNEEVGSDSSSEEIYLEISEAAPMDAEDQQIRMRYWIDQAERSRAIAKSHVLSEISLLANECKQEAINSYVRASQADSNSPLPFHGLAEMAFEEGNFRASVEYDLKAIELSGGYTQPYLRLATVAKRERNLDLARYFLDKVIELDPWHEGAIDGITEIETIQKFQ